MIAVVLATPDRVRVCFRSLEGTAAWPDGCEFVSRGGVTELRAWRSVVCRADQTRLCLMEGMLNRDRISRPQS